MENVVNSYERLRVLVESLELDVHKSANVTRVPEFELERVFALSRERQQILCAHL